MKYPREFIQIDDCFALLRKPRGTGRSIGKVGEPLTEGYIRTQFQGEDWKASRLSYHLNVGSIPRSPKSLKEGIILHSCDNGWCINPEHLSIGTCSKNIKEMYERHPTIRSQRRSQGVERFKDENYREWMRENQRAAAKRQWANPESRAKIMAGLRSQGKKS